MTLAVILVNHNGRADLQKCLSSLEPEKRSVEMEVVVIDNNSSDGSQELVRNSFPWVRLIENRENVGYARANNQGIRASSAESILFLNPDTVISGGVIGHLLEELKKRPEAAAIAPRLRHEDGSFQVSFGQKVDFWAELFQKLLFNPFYRLRLRFFNRPRKVGWLSGACLLVRRQAVEEVGLFDENFFLYFEDIDLCVRLRKRGWQLVFDPEVTVLHAGGASTSARRLFSRLEYRRSQVYFYQKHNSRFSLFFLRLYLRVIFVFWRRLAFRTDEQKAIWREKTLGLFKKNA